MTQAFIHRGLLYGIKFGDSWFLTRVKLLLFTCECQARADRCQQHPANPPDVERHEQPFVRYEQARRLIPFQARERVCKCWCDLPLAVGHP